MSAQMHDLRLSPPADGSDHADHNDTFETWDFCFDVVRDTINIAVRALNSVGAGLHELPGGSLDDLLVKPLSGDWSAMRGNAAACQEVNRAMTVVALDAEDVGVDVALRWHGLAGAACLQRLSQVSVAALLMGQAVGRADALLHTVADVSERLGVEVERLIVQVGTALARLFRKVLARAAGVVGWAYLATELAIKGFDSVRDIIDDLELIWKGWQALKELIPQARAWAEAQTDRLAIVAAVPGRVADALR